MTRPNTIVALAAGRLSGAFGLPPPPPAAAAPPLAAAPGWAGY